MKILLHDDTPSFLTPGGKQVHAQNMYENLKALGQDVEYSRWWDPTQKCDLIHLFSPSPWMIHYAREAGVKVVITQIVEDLTNQTKVHRLCRSILGNGIRTFFPASIQNRFWWSALPLANAIVYMNKYDAETAISVYGVPRKNTHIIPHGVSVDRMTRLQGGPRRAHSYLISVAGIVPRKNSILLAKAAKRANVPIVFLGKPFNEKNSYYQEFLKLVDGKIVMYPGYVSEETKNQLLTEASGFVLLSKAESGCISVYEAAAAGLPLLLSNLPWALDYGMQSTIQHVYLNDEAVIATRLSLFFAESMRLANMTFPVLTWEEIAKNYIQVYKETMTV